MSRQNVKNTMIDKVLAFVAPHLCFGCGLEGYVLCDNCKYDIIKYPDEGSKGLESEPFENSWVVGERRAVLQRTIGAFKFQNMRLAGGDLAQLLASRLPDVPEGTVFVPIPTAAPHIRERGYDHALLLTRQLGRLRGIPVERLLARRHDKTQHHANRHDRIQQAAMAFRISGGVDPHGHYVLVDDVLTTGSTLRAAARCLRTAGATHVSIAVLARQPLD